MNNTFPFDASRIRLEEKIGNTKYYQMSKILKKYDYTVSLCKKDVMIDNRDRHRPEEGEFVIIEIPIVSIDIRSKEPLDAIHSRMEDLFLTWTSLSYEDGEKKCCTLSSKGDGAEEAHKILSEICKVDSFWRQR